MRFFVAPFLLSLFVLPGAKAQDTLPGFTASLKSNGRVLISWRNIYPSINQISIQRSADSLRNFTSLITVPDPHLPENGFVDSKAQGTRMFYRIFILFGNSKYMFTKSKRALAEPVERLAKQEHQVSRPEVIEEKDLTLPKIDNSRIFYLQHNRTLKKPIVSSPSKIETPTITVEKTLFVKRRDSVIRQLAGNKVRLFSDSILKQTKDTLLFVDADTLLIKPFVEQFREVKELYKISPFVYTAKDGNVNISLKDWNRKKYTVSFFEQDHTLVMEVKNIKDSLLIIDKVNFMHAGWFRFELYEDGHLKEKNKFFISKEF